jgi:hypothetical protein
VLILADDVANLHAVFDTVYLLNQGVSPNLTFQAKRDRLVCPSKHLCDWRVKSP